MTNDPRDTDQPVEPPDIADSGRTAEDVHPAAPAQPADQPEGYTPEAPKPSELGAKGTPGAAMTPAAPHATDARLAEEHSAEIHDDAEGHDEPRLGPIDWGAWVYAGIGIGAGAVIVLLFWLATR
ncbi:MAG TPA: hypothetical protein VNW68_00615 [Candidatus Limnocylindria bacterium]|nr:hypothetical protein [Candidatus Limnocylindria bacterium]